MYCFNIETNAYKYSNVILTGTISLTSVRPI